MVMWLDDLPEEVVPSNRDARNQDLVSAAPSRTRPAPPVPDSLIGWLDAAGPWQPDSPEPRLVSMGPLGDIADSDGVLSPPSGSVEQAYRSWLETWRAWQADAVRVARRQQIYGALETAAKETSQNDDTMELVLAVGLVVWAAPDGRRLRRHLMTEQVAVAVDRSTARITVSLAGAQRRLEDQDLFLGLGEIFHPDRATDRRRDLLDAGTELPLEPRQLRPLLEWLPMVVDAVFHESAEPQEHLQPLTDQPVISFSPALILRPRSRVLLSEAYSKIAQDLKTGDVSVPVSLAQLVCDTEPADRNRWLDEQNLLRGEVLGKDPLFPLKANDEQRRVMEVLREETGIVVQGPPGTGKTHTIANLVCALLARGQRVLVTSHKEQALRVLRDKIPVGVRPLCVMLAGGSGNGGQELERSLSAFSDLIAASDRQTLAGEVTRLRTERERLQARAAELNTQIQRLRDSELQEHPPLVPGFSRTAYQGRLARIVEQVVAQAPRYDWFPASGSPLPDIPPLDLAELLDLRRTLTEPVLVRETRLRQWFPEPSGILPAHEFAVLVHAVQQAQENVEISSQDHPTDLDLTRMTSATVTVVAQATSQLDGILHRLGPRVLTHRQIDEPWIRRAVEDRLSHRHRGVWDGLLAEKDQAATLLEDFRRRGLAVVDLELDDLTLGQQRGLLERGRALQAYLSVGGKIKRFLPDKAQTRAKDFLARVRVNGAEAATAETVAIAVHACDVRITTGQLVDRWTDTGIALDAAPARTREVLSELADRVTTLAAVDDLAHLADEIAAALNQDGLVVDLTSLTALAEVRAAVEVTLARLRLTEAAGRLERLTDALTPPSEHAVPAPEIDDLVAAIQRHDSAGYAQARARLDQARAGQDAARQADALRDRLRAVHPALLGLLERDPADPRWDDRLRDLPHAWAWRIAATFVAAARSLEEELKLSAEFRETEDRLAHKTAEQVAAEATHACLGRITDTQVRALRTYQSQVMHIGAGAGKRSKAFARTSRAALADAKDAVPAWVVPLPRLLDNLPAVKDSFDVVIVDEASQVGMESLFLTWLAPRIIVVGDDKQCTPADNRLGTVDSIQGLMDTHLGELDPVIAQNFTEKSNLYELMSARSGLDSVIRLQEHFRCVPEIINWSSTRFYDPQEIS